MSRWTILLLLTVAASALTLAGCGQPGSGGSSGGARAERPAPPGALATRTDALTAMTIEGEKAFGYAIDLPAGYERAGDPGRHLWQVKGTSGSVAPRVRVWNARVPTLEEAGLQASKGPAGVRNVILVEEDDERMVVIGRDPDGTWTQVDCWVKGEGLRPFARIELRDVGESSPQVEWAKRVMASLQAVE